jgi:protein-S-isoprenylcysteine O-methyltransferase Ste14
MLNLLRIYPPVWLLVLLAAAIAAHYLVPESRVFDVSYPVLGILLIVIGFAGANVASAFFRKEGTEILPTSETNSVLVTHGLYKYTRNPMYLGMVITLLGAAFIGGTLPFFLAALADFLILNFVFIPFEEKKLERIFGEQYLSYKRSVRRWL